MLVVMKLGLSISVMVTSHWSAMLCPVLQPFTIASKYISDIQKSTLVWLVYQVSGNHYLTRGTVSHRLFEVAPTKEKGIRG